MAAEAVIHPPKTMMEIFKSLPEGTRVQLVNDHLIMSPSPSDAHQKVLGKIFKKLDDFVEAHDLGEVRIAPYDVYLSEKNAFQPDILFVAKKNLGKIQKNGLHGTPDLVIEIVSPSNRVIDENDKKEVYRQLGVSEYFIVDPYEKTIISYKLVNDEYHEMDCPKGVIHSVQLDTSINF